MIYEDKEVKHVHWVAQSQDITIDAALEKYDFDEKGMIPMDKLKDPKA